MEVCPNSYFWWCGYSWAPRVSLIRDFCKKYFKDRCLINPSDFYLIFWLNEMAILYRVRKPDNFESRNYLSLSFARIRGLCYNFFSLQIFPWIKLFWSLCETNLEDSVDYSNISVRDYLPLIRKNSVTHMHGLTSLSTRLFYIPRKPWRLLYMFWTSFFILFHQT